MPTMTLWEGGWAEDIQLLCSHLWGKGMGPSKYKCKETGGESWQCERLHKVFFN